MHLGEDGSPIYTDRFRELNSRVLQLVNELYPLKSLLDIEEAEICLSLLMGFSATIYNLEEQEEKLQVVLDRASQVLTRLEFSLLKCRLLISCYAEVLDKKLLEEAKEIIVNWGGRELTDDEKEMMGVYNELILKS